MKNISATFTIGFCLGIMIHSCSNPPPPKPCPKCPECLVTKDKLKKTKQEVRAFIQKKLQ